MLPPVHHIQTDDMSYLVMGGQDMISQTLFKFGAWDLNSVKLARLFLNDIPAPIVLDIGANLGTFALPVAKHIASSGGQVICYEPQRIVYYQLCGNIVLNRIDNCIAMNQAVGDQNATLKIPEIEYSSNRNIGAFSLHEKYRKLHGIEPSMKQSHHTVQMVCLDQVNLPARVHLIKLDVEGFEYPVIKGAQTFLKSHQFPPIMFEAWSFDWFQEEKKSLFDLIEKNGYQVTQYDTSNFIAQHPQNEVDVCVEKTGEQDLFKIYRKR